MEPQGDDHEHAHVSESDRALLPRDEDFNEPSQERITILEELDRILGTDVPSHFRALGYFCDIKKLKEWTNMPANLMLCISDSLNVTVIGCEYTFSVSVVFLGADEDYWQWI